MAKRDYDKDLRTLRKELRKRIKQHKKRTDLQQEIEKTKLLKKRALTKQAKKVKKKPKPVKRIPVKTTKRKPVKKVVAKKKVVAPPPLPKRKKKPAPKKKLSKKKVVSKKKKLKKRKWYEPTPKPEKPKVKIYVREVGDAKGFSEEDEEDAPEEVFMNSSYGTRSVPNETNVSKIFENAFTGFIRKGPFEKDDVNIYRHGVIFRPAHGEWNEKITEKISDIVSEVPGSSMHVVPEDKTFSLRVNFGSPDIASNYSEVTESFKELAPIIRKIYDVMYDYGYEDIDWFDFWDTEEAPY